MDWPVHSNSVIPALAALALESRFEAVRLLSELESGGLPAGEIARRLNVRQNTMSDHLKTLTQAGILTAERQSKSIIYKVHKPTLEAVVHILREKLRLNTKA